MKSLIVEDDKVSRQVLEKMISRHGSYHSAGNGREAAELFRRAHEAGEPYDLVLMDIMIPEVDGLKAVLEMRQSEARREIPGSRRVKIVMTTALDDSRIVMKALYESAANSYLVKPIRLKELEDELRALRLIE